MLLRSRWWRHLKLNGTRGVPYYKRKLLCRPTCFFSISHIKEPARCSPKSSRPEKVKHDNKDACPCGDLPLSSWAFRTQTLCVVFREHEFQALPLFFSHAVELHEVCQSLTAVDKVFSCEDISGALQQLARIPRLFLPLPSAGLHASEMRSTEEPTPRLLSGIHSTFIRMPSGCSPEVGTSDGQNSTMSKSLPDVTVSRPYYLSVSDGGFISTLQQEFLLQVLVYLQRMKCAHHLNEALGSKILSFSSTSGVETSSLVQVEVENVACSKSRNYFAAWPHQSEEARLVIELVAWYRHRERISVLVLVFAQVCSQDMSRRKHFIRWLSTELEAALNPSRSSALLPGTNHSCLLWFVNRVEQLDSQENEESESSWIVRQESLQKWLSTCTDCICGASYNDLFSREMIAMGGIIPNTSTSTRTKHAQKMGVVHPLPFCELACLFNSLPQSTTCTLVLPSARRCGKTLADDEDGSFWHDIARISKHDAGIDTASRVLRRRLAGLNIPICPSLCIYWRCVLVEMLRSAWEAVEVLTGNDGPYHLKGDAPYTQLKTYQASAKLLKSAEHYTVGVFLSFRRIQSAFSRHQLLQPLIDLHELVTGYCSCPTAHQKCNSSAITPLSNEPSNDLCYNSCNRDSSEETNELVHFATRASAFRRDILSGKVSSPLIWREIVLFDAFTLINLGHTSEKAADFWNSIGHSRASTVDAMERVPKLSLLDERDLVGVRNVLQKSLQLNVQQLRERLAFLQMACLDHLALLEARTNNAGAPLLSTESDARRVVSLDRMKSILSKITPRTRDRMISRLREGLRLSSKILLSLGDTAAICALYKVHGSLIGGSWEVGKALMQEKSYEAALDAFQQLLSDTHKQHTSGLPRFIQDMILEAVSQVSQEIVSIAEAQQQESKEDPVAMLMQRYEKLRSWSGRQPLPAPLCFDALLKGVLSGVSLVATPTTRLHVDIASRFVMQYVSRHGIRDGLLSSSIETWIQSFVKVQQATASDNGRFKAMERDFFRTFAILFNTFPHLSITRISLACFLRTGYQQGVRMVLWALVSPKILHPLKALPTSLSSEQDTLSQFDFTAESCFSDSYIEATFTSLPIKIVEELLIFLASDDATSAVTLFSALDCGQIGCFEETRLARLKEICETTMKYYNEFRSQQRPWQCFLCRTWNSRFTTACTHCKSLDTAVVQCAQCSGFASTKDAACLVCGADFVAGLNAMPCKETALHQPTSRAPVLVPVPLPRPLQKTGDGRSADVILRSTSYKAIFPLRAWTCHDCGRANEAKHIFYCAFCNSQHPAMRKTLRETSYSCRTCGHANSFGLLRPWCNMCGMLSPIVPTPEKKTLWYCPACHHLNPWLLVHCERCVEPRPLFASSSGRDLVHYLPSLLCDDNNTRQVLAPSSPVITIPWCTPPCPKCQVVNPIVAKCCRGCGCTLKFPSTVSEIITSGVCEWLKKIFVAPPQEHSFVREQGPLLVKEPVEPTHAASRPIVCIYCGSSEGNSVHGGLRTEPVCGHCHACFPGSTVTLWVCLQPKCFHVNMKWHTKCTVSSQEAANGERSNEALRSPMENSPFYLCSACHTSHRAAEIFQLWLDKPIAVPPPQRTWKSTGDAVTALGYGGELSRMNSVTGLLCLPPVSGPTPRCTECVTYLGYTNLACVCPQCGLCQPSFICQNHKLERAQHRKTLFAEPLPTQTTLSGWLILSRLSQALKRIAYNQENSEEVEVETSNRPRLNQSFEPFPMRTDLTWIQKFLHSAVSVLRSTREDLLPWRGCDLQNRMLCGVESRVAVLDDEMESVHSAILLVRSIIESVCLMARSISRDQNTDPPIFPERPESDAVWQKQRPWLLAAADLVDVVNSSTEFDEIGFLLLSQLCQLIRPHEVEHIQSKTRWEYLHAMKLTREAMVHEVVCVRCFGRHKKDAGCFF